MKYITELMRASFSLSLSQAHKLFGFRLSPRLPHASHQATLTQHLQRTWKHPLLGLPSTEEPLAHHTGQLSKPAMAACTWRSELCKRVATPELPIMENT